ncbi:hypothetical protein PL373_03780 [Tenacibaculum maritimum]|nr:hypothetical protein [Tenacibaculum maritimum]MDB0600274.1 hypothetical protein [Tenacibaculum maritimum]MDB0610784.1 hypothetical protein [Tenacibaculum maritimum]
MIFVFYELEFINLLRSVNQLSLINNEGCQIIVPTFQLNAYGYKTTNLINKSIEEGLLKEVDLEGFDEFLINTKVNYGKGFLYLLFCCLKKSSILVIDKKENTLISYANSLGVATMSINDFTKSVIKNEPYIDFLIKIKDDVIKIKS